MTTITSFFFRAGWGFITRLARKAKVPPVGTTGRRPNRSKVLLQGYVPPTLMRRIEREIEASGTTKSDYMTRRLSETPPRNALTAAVAALDATLSGTFLREEIDRAVEAGSSAEIVAALRALLRTHVDNLLAIRLAVLAELEALGLDNPKPYSK